MNAEECAYLSFSLSPIGPKRFLQLVSHFGTAEKAWNTTATELRPFEIGEITYKKFDDFRKSFDVSEYQEKLMRAKVTVLAQNHALYPESLKKIPDPPIVLFCKGNTSLLCHADPELVEGEESPVNKGLPETSFEILRQKPQDDRKTIAVVGTRKITSYGREVTEKLVSELTLSGFTIISGLAFGVDATAHKTALEHQGATLAVLGCGVDCCSPEENSILYEEILDHNGLIISEYPLGMSPNKGTFPARNRIIAALSNGVLVTEAGEDSGSLITAQCAKNFGKAVFAVPGPITSQQSAGTSQLLKAGAKVVTSASDILSEFGLNKKMEAQTIDIELLDLTKEEKTIVTLLQQEALPIDELAKKSEIPIAQLSIILSSLELKDIIKNTQNGFQLS